jgi:hypothetical protein
MSQMIKLGALWVGKDKDGQPMMSGTINQTTRILVLKNGFKKEDKQPDYIIYVAPNEKKEAGKKQEEDFDLPF